MRNNDEKTPFDFAKENGKLDVASFLAKRSRYLCAPNTVDSAPVKASFQDTLPSPDGSEVLEQHMDGSPSSDNGTSDLLHNASADGRIDIVRRLLDRGADVNERNKHLITPLAIASKQGNLAIARTLIKYGAEVNSRDKFGWTSLHRAAQEGHIEVVELLLDNGADIHATQREGATALHCTSHRVLVTSKLCGYSLNGEQTCKSELCTAERPLSSHYCLDNRRSRSFCQSMMSVEYRYSTNKGLMARYICT